jgi:hypothetical protein
VRGSSGNPNLAVSVDDATLDAFGDGSFNSGGPNDRQSRCGAAAADRPGRRIARGIARKRERAVYPRHGKPVYFPTGLTPGLP